MKIRVERNHTVRPQDYESVGIRAAVEIDLDNEADAEFRDMPMDEIGDELSTVLDDLVDKDVVRTLRLDGDHIEETHLWAFYGMD